MSDKNMMPMLAGVGLLSMCCISSSLAATVMGGSKETPDPGAGAGAAAKDTTPAPIGLYSTTDGIRHQINNPEGEDLFYYRLSNTEWNKYYKFSCKSPSGAESSKLGPYGPVTMNTYHGPKLRIAPAGTKPCGDTNKMHIYRAQGSGGAYTDVTSEMKNLDGNAVYNGMDPAFLDIYGMGPA